MTTTNVSMRNKFTIWLLALNILYSKKTICHISASLGTAYGKHMAGTMTNWHDLATRNGFSKLDKVATTESNVFISQTVSYYTYLMSHDHKNSEQESTRDTCRDLWGCQDNPDVLTFTSTAIVMQIWRNWMFTKRK